MLSFSFSLPHVQMQSSDFRFNGIERERERKTKREREEKKRRKREREKKEKQDAHDSETKNEEDNDRFGADQQCGGNREDKSGTGHISGIGCAETAPEFFFSTNAVDVVARIEGDVNVVRMQEVRPNEGTNGERRPGIQLTQLDTQAADAPEMASQIQAVEALRQAEKEEKK